MGVTNGTIRRPVGIPDVRSVLGTSSGDLATLCLMTNINMWSGRKPVYMAIKEVLTDAQWKTGRTLSGYSVSYGIKKRALTAISDYVDSSGNVKNEVWSYDKPVKDNANIFRLSDFENYKHNSINPMVITLPTNSTMYVTSGSQKGTQLNFQINFPFNRVTQTDYENGNIGSEQLFGGLESYYPSVLMTYGAGSTIRQYCKSASIAISEIGRSSAQSGVTITIYGSDLYNAMSSDGTLNAVAENAKWTACLVLTSRKLDGANSPIANHAAFGYNNTIVVRLEHTAAVNNVWVDRKVLTIVPFKKSYISSMKARFTLESVNSWWTITSIQFIADVEQSVSDLAFTASASAATYGQIYVGTNYVANQYPNISQLTVNNFSTANLSFASTTGTGVQRSLTYLATKYSPVGSPSAPYKPLISLIVTLHNNTYGDWTATLTIQDDLSPRTVEVNCV